MTVSKARAAAALGAASVVAIAVSGCSAESLPTVSPAPASVLIDQDFPDPDVLAVDGQYVAFATNAHGANVQFATSPDLTQWTVSLDDALPDLPAWASIGRTWAPDVSALASGGYVMYFVAQHTASGKQCIGAATSSVVTGPFAPAEGEPLVCDLDEGGAIDPATFTDTDGQRYLVWKNDGNCCGLDTWIQLAPLSADGLQLIGPPTMVFKQTEQWEGQLVEAPVLVKHGDSYVLFYSANDYGSDQYAIGVATSPSLSGPWVKQPSPFLSTESSAGRYLGPGGQDVITTPEGDVMLFHGWNELYQYRGMYSVPLEWTGDVPSPRLD